MKILITGAHGQLGNELKDTSVHHPSFEGVYLDSNELDITDAVAVDKIFAKEHFDICINCAAYTAVDKAESEVEKAFNINAGGAENLAKAAARHKVKFIQISTDFVFNGQLSAPYQEDDVTEPLSTYGRSKLEGETLCMAANPDSIIVRTAWVYSHHGNNFVKTMRRLGHDRNSLGVIYDQVGTPTYARDLANALWHIVKHLDSAAPGIYHYTNEGVASWYDFAVAIMELSGLKCKVKPINTFEYPTPATRPAYCILDKKKIKTTFNIEIPHWRESLQHCITLLNKHEV